MNRAEEIAAKAARLRGAPATPATSSEPAEPVSPSAVTPVRNGVTAEDAPAPPQAKAAVRAPRARPVRLSVDVAPADHRALDRVAADVAERLGVVRVHHQEVQRALLSLLFAGGDLVDQVTAEVERQRRLRP